MSDFLLWRPFFIFSHFRTEYLNPEDEPCLCICLCVQINHFHNFRPILMKMHSNDLNKNLRRHFFSFFFNFCFDDVITVISYVFRWDTLMVAIFKQFSSNWQHDFFYGWVCMGLQTSVLRHHLQGKMTVGKTVKKRSNVKLKTNHRFL